MDDLERKKRFACVFLNKSFDFENIKILIERNMKNSGEKYSCKSIMGFKNMSEPVYEEDIITIMKFNREGNMLGLGDKSGRVILFKFGEDGKVSYYT